MITKYFSCKDVESRKEVLWSLGASGANPKRSHAGSVEAGFADEYALVAWAGTHRKLFGYVTIEVKPGSHLCQFADNELRI